MSNTERRTAPGRPTENGMKVEPWKGLGYVAPSAVTFGAPSSTREVPTSDTGRFCRSRASMAARRMAGSPGAIRTNRTLASEPEPVIPDPVPSSARSTAPASGVDAPVDPVEGSKMHRMYGGKSLATKNARSVTPRGFAYAFFAANNAVDHPAMAISNKYDRLNQGVIRKAVELGCPPWDAVSTV